MQAELFLCVSDKDDDQSGGFVGSWPAAATEIASTYSLHI